VTVLADMSTSLTPPSFSRGQFGKALIVITAVFILYLTLITIYNPDYTPDRILAGSGPLSRPSPPVTPPTQIPPTNSNAPPVSPPLVQPTPAPVPPPPAPVPQTPPVAQAPLPKQRIQVQTIGIDWEVDLWHVSIHTCLCSISSRG